MQAAKVEGILDGPEQRVVVVGCSILHTARAVVGDYDGRDVATAGIGIAAASDASGVEVILVPGNDDGVVALGPDTGGGNRLDGIGDIGIASLEQRGVT